MGAAVGSEVLGYAKTAAQYVGSTITHPTDFVSGLEMSSGGMVARSLSGQENVANPIEPTDQTPAALRAQDMGEMLGDLPVQVVGGVAGGLIGGAATLSRTMSALSMPQVCETYERQRALRHLEDKRVIVFAGGTGNPYFTTDTTAVLRAAEMGCEAVLKATDVDGVYTADPKRDPSATRYQQLTHQEALDRRLKIMDATAFALAQENRMPIIVFSILEQGSIANVLLGKGHFTIVG